MTQPASDLPSFGQMLRQFRLRLGLSQSELADRARLSSRAISDLERGVREKAYVPTVEALSAALHLSGDDRASFGAAVRRARVPRGADGAMDDATRQALVGRRRELRLVLDTLMRGKSRLVTVTGPPKVGKTLLAFEAGRELARWFKAEVTYISLEGQSEPLEVRDVIERALKGVNLSPGTEEISRSYDRSPTRLLILDNLEHLLPLCEALQDLLSRFSRLSLLVVSRTPTHEASEIVIPLRLQQGAALKRRIA